MQKKHDEGKLKDQDLTTIDNCVSRLASAESAMKTAQPCYPKGWTKWDKINIEGKGSVFERLEETTANIFTPKLSQQLLNNYYN